jgi:hypothetical protein
MKQSSMSGSSEPRVKGFLPSNLENALMPPVGMPPSSTGRYELVAISTTVPAVDGPPVRLK